MERGEGKLVTANYGQRERKGSHFSRNMIIFDFRHNKVNPSGGDEVDATGDEVCPQSADESVVKKTKRRSGRPLRRLSSVITSLFRKN